MLRGKKLHKRLELRPFRVDGLPQRGADAREGILGLGGRQLAVGKLPEGRRLLAATAIFGRLKSGKRD